MASYTIIDGNGVLQTVTTVQPFPAGSPDASNMIGVQGAPGMIAVKIDGSATTQPISAVSLPLPTGAAQASKQPAFSTAGTASPDFLSVQGGDNMKALKIDGSAVTQPVSLAAIPLATNAAQASKQPAFGVAGTASPDFLSVQGNDTMSPLLTKTAASENHLGEIGGRLFLTFATFSRPSDVIGYTANDAISNSVTAPLVLTFPNASRILGQGGYISKVVISTDAASTNTRFRLHVFNTAPGAIIDNTPYNLLWTDRTSRVAIIDLPFTQTEGGSSSACIAINNYDRTPFICAPDSRALYGILETRDGFAPASGQNFYVELTIDQY